MTSPSYEIYLAASFFISICATILMTVYSRPIVEARMRKSIFLPKTHENDHSVVNLRYLFVFRDFFVVYFFINAADWLKAPYGLEYYKVAAKHSRWEIAILFIFGFVVSLVFGAVMGAIADNYGRKRLVLFFCACYIVSALSFVSHSFYIHLIGRGFAGIGNSLLLSVFESWIVSECRGLGSPLFALNLIFGLSTLGNAYVAISAGFIGHVSVYRIKLLWVPFVVSAILLIIAALYVMKMWRENYGKRQSTILLSMRTAINIVANERQVFLLGASQTLVESVHSVFHYTWGETFKLAHSTVSIFASFMLWTAIGAVIYLLLFFNNVSTTLVAIGAVSVAMVDIFIASLFHSNQHVQFFLFCIFELCNGVLIPCFASLRTQYIPEDYRTLIISINRIPVNIGMILVLIFINLVPFWLSFIACSFALALALGILVYYHINISNKILSPISNQDDL